MIPSTKATQAFMSRFMLFGTLTAMAIVLIGGILYLWQHGNETLQTELLNLRQPMGLLRTWEDLQTATPIGLIELGLGLLIATQVLRMVWLIEFYLRAHDLWFTAFSTFILTAILYSLFVMG